MKTEAPRQSRDREEHAWVATTYLGCGGELVWTLVPQLTEQLGVVLALGVFTVVVPPLIEPPPGAVPPLGLYPPDAGDVGGACVPPGPAGNLAGACEGTVAGCDLAAL